MAMATDLMSFFLSSIERDSTGIHEFVPRTIGEFLKEHDEYVQRFFEVQGICQRLVDRHVLTRGGLRRDGNLVLNETYYVMNDPPEFSQYGTYDFYAFGFPYVREHFLDSVIPVLVREQNGGDAIGTAFLIESHRYVVTARHCVEGKKDIRLPNCKGIIEKCFVGNDPSIDVAILKFSEDPLPEKPGFKLRAHQILEPVLTMGFPPIPLFDAILVSETMQISTDLKSSSGIAVAEGASYLSAQEYFLLNARVKGGNSGGPIIGEDGFVTGIITEMPAGEDGIFDQLAYGVATPVAQLKNLIDAIESDDKSNFKILSI